MTELDELLEALDLARDGRGRALREHADISLRTLASILTVDPATLSRWERGLTKPRGEAAGRWAQACRRITEERGRRRGEVAS